MRRAIKKFWHLRDVDGMTEREAAEECWKAYKGLHLVKHKIWKPTKGNQTERRGPVPPPFKMTRKTGPKPKLDKKARDRYWKSSLISTAWSSWSLCRQRIRSMLMAAMICSTLLKNGNCKTTLSHCVLITLFAIGNGPVMKFVMHGRYSGASCERFGEIREGYRREFGSTIYSGLVEWNWWWTRHRFRKWVWLWVELEFPFKIVWKTFNFCILHVLKGFLPFFCQDLPVIWVKWSGRFEIQLCQVNRNR